MLKIVRTAFLLFSGIILLTGSACAESLRESVVKVFVTSNSIDFTNPWQSQGSNSSSGSGFIISGNRILTNAHVVSDSTFIQVRKENSPGKYAAKVVAIGHDCDLAVLTVDDPDFFKGITPLEFGELPLLQDTVTVIGFPMGGDKLSITKGVVSRIEIIPYSQSAKKLLAVQIDAAINPGNSGGPVLKDGKVVGVAMQIISNSQNIGYMIPTPNINHFLEDLKDGKYDGFPVLGIEYESTENIALRQFYHLPAEAGGVLITKVLPFSSADGNLREGDTLLEIDGTPLGVDGTFTFRKDERLGF
jgi:S1-C subfamily serine protease